MPLSHAIMYVILIVFVLSIIGSAIFGSGFGEK